MRAGLNASAGKKYNIPRTTLIYKFSGKLPLVKCKKGPAPRMGEQGEVMPKNWVMALATRGFPVTKTDLLTSVKQIVKDLHVENLFEKGRPGNKWLCLFLKRHLEIAERTVEKLCQVRANVTERFIRNWFTEVQQYFTENDLNGALADPNRVFNMDESAFFL